MMTTLPHHYCWLLCLEIVGGPASSELGLVGAPLFLEPASTSIMRVVLVGRSPSQIHNTALHDPQQQKEPSKSSGPSPAPPARARPWAPATWILGPSWRPPTSHPGSCHRTPGEDIHHESHQEEAKADYFEEDYCDT